MNKNRKNLQNRNLQNKNLQEKNKKNNNLIFSSEDAEHIFTNIYAVNYWGNGSGEGSLYENNKIYIDFLENKLKELNVKKVIDLGCGDWQFSKYINWDGYEYLGMDVVDNLIKEHNEKFGKENIHFQQCNIIEDYESIPPSDVYIFKDVIQHWKNENIRNVLPSLKKKCKYMIITNCYPKKTNDIPESPDIEHIGKFRPLSYLKEPLSLLNPKPVLYYYTKEVNIIEGDLIES